MKRKQQIVTTFAAAGTLLMLATSSTVALSHTSVTVDGSTSPSSVAVTGDNINSVVFTTDWNIVTSCADSTISGNVFPGTPVTPGNVVGELTGFTFSNCFVAGGMPVIIEMNPSATIDFEVNAHPAAAGDPVDVVITGIDAHLHSTTPAIPTSSNRWACELNAKGTLNATIHPGDSTNDGYVEIHPGFTLNDLRALDGTNTNTDASSSGTGNPTTCAGQLQTGDIAEMTGEFTMDTNGAGIISHG